MKKWKAFYKPTTATLLHRAQTNVQLQISSTKTLLWACSTTTLFRNFAILRQQYSFPFAPIQILTVDTRKPCGFHRGRLHDERRSFRIKLRIERRFESSPGVQRVATLGVFLRYFLHAAKSTNPFPCRELRGFTNLDSARRNGGFALTKLKPSQKEIRGSANLESAHKTKISH